MRFLVLGIHALSNINLTLYPGKVNAIIGENGAGKSTLMKIFSGVYTQYEGQIIYQGNSIKFSGTKDAENAGIAIIHQELNLVPYLSYFSLLHLDFSQILRVELFLQRNIFKRKYFL